jgi:hypothetical protein
MKGKGLDRLGGHLGIISKDMYRLLRINADWTEIAGDVFAGHTIPAKLKGGKLEVLCDSTVWVQQIGLLELSLIENIRKCTDLRIREIDPRIGVLRQEVKAVLKKTEPFELNIDSRAYEDVENPELKERIKALVRVRE